MQVRLTHQSCVPGAEGMPGDIVDAKDDQANAWLKNGGAVRVKDATDESDTPAPPADAGNGEPPAETGGTREAPRSRRRPGREAAED